MIRSRFRITAVGHSSLFFAALHSALWIEDVADAMIFPAAATEGVATFVVRNERRRKGGSGGSAGSAGGADAASILKWS